MRVGVWCGVAVTLLIVATNAARTVQTEGVSRTNRRITTTERNGNNLNKNEENIPTSRPRSIRRREQTQESSTIRSRTRGRTLEYENISPKIETEVQSGQNGSFESRKSSTRSRSRIIGKETTTEKILSRESIIRGRSRGNGRKYTSTTSAQNDQTENLLNNVPATFKPRSVEFKANEILPTAETAPSNQFRRRSSTVSSVDDRKQIKPRGRVNTRINSRALDLEVAGTTNTFTEADKQTTNTRIIDGRNSRKLRYKSRTIETDTNLTGEGLTTLNTVETSSQGNDIPSQPELSVLNSTIFTPTDNTFQPSTESVLTSSTLKAMKIVRRPITRNNGYLKSSDVKSNSKMSDEISEDDNYPESFKALIQAKNATQADSPIDESFSVKESHKVTKTHALSVQSNTTDPVIDKNSRLRKKLQKEKSEKNQIEDSSLSLTSTTTTSEAPKPRSIPFRPRSTYLARGKKLNVTKSTTENINYATRTGDNPYKFSKRTKSSTEPSKTDITLKTKRVDTLPKKQIMRSSLFSRKNDPVDKNISVIPLNENRKHDRVQSGSHFKTRRTLPSTTYYSRLRNNTKLYLTENSFIEKNTETPIADKKVENSADMPLIFTYLNRPVKKENLQSTSENNATATTRSLNGKESQENSTENEIVNKAEESENKFINTDATTQKYHANYKEKMQSEKAVSSATPVIRNIKTRKYARKQEKTSRDQAATTTPPVIFKSKERNVRKYSDSENFSKTTESPANSISQEPEKPKHKFSSKYRGSYLDRPIYKPTVPTVTPSTNAWEKFFVTDEYTEFVEEPILFGIEFSNNTTEMISRMNFTSPTYTHESSIELVEGEEIQLGPDMNAIAITKTHRPLSSADLRLSESLAKPLQVLNVEASHHSPSVTVSIFDALAEILTSTPKPRISTTTEILPKNTNEIDIMHSLDGVSSNVNVNTVTGFASPDTVTSKDNLNTNAKFVQTTEQVVFNSLLVGDNVTPSLNADEDKTSFVTSPTTVPTPTPTTPVSARKPFAIKVLYSETESTNQNSPTAMPSTTATSTDKSTMVYNSISDLLQSNNGLVSSGLTSMLSNNIRSIIDSMDDETKSRLSVGMTNLLNTLTPSGINNVPKVEDDNTPYMTTPYSLEDIKDTENIDINFNDSSNIYNILQNDSTAENIVNSTVTLLNSQNEVATESPIPKNISQSLNNVQNLESESGSDIILENNIIVTTSKHTESTTAGLIFVNSNTENLDETFTNEQPVTSSTVPFKTQAEIPNTQLQSLSDSELLSFNQLYDSGELQDINQVSQLQLWILSKKARVLKMIEDILRKHSEEISNPPLSVLNLNKPNISLSNRLTEIINTMNLTTIEPDSTEQTTFNLIESNSYSTPTVPLTSTISLENNINDVDSDVTTQNANDFTMTNDQSSTDTISRIADAFTTANSVHTTTVSENISTISNFEDEENESSNLLSTTTTNNLETTTEMAKARIEFDTTTKTNLEETTTSGIESLTTTVINDSKSADFTTTRNMLNVLTRPSIPKKDFVIFGILPNNTVVRKDPNDNPLEALTEASPYIIYGVLPNNTIIRKFPNGTRVPQIMQKIDVLPISPWSLKNPYSPIHNIPAIVRPQSNPIRVSTNTVISTDIPNNEKEISLTTDTVNNLQVMIPTSTLNLKDSSSLGITTTSTQPPAEKSTASHVLSLRTTTTLPSVDEILLNSISLATKEEMVISSMTSSTPEPRILTLDIDPETKQIRTEKPKDGTGNTVFKFIPIEDVTVPYTQETNVLKLASPKNMRVTTALNIQTATMSGTTEVNTQTPQIQINTESTTVTTTIEPSIGTSFESNSEKVNDEPPTPVFMNEFQPTTESQKFTVTDLNNDRTTFRPEQTTVPSTTGTFIPELQVNSIGFTNSNQNEITTATTPTTDRVPTATSVPIGSATNTVFQTQTNPLPLYNERNPKNIPGFNIAQNQQLENAKLLQALLMATNENKNSNNNLLTKTQSTTVRSIEDDIRQFEEDTKLLKALLQATGRDPASLNLPSLDDIKAVITTLKPSVETTTIQTTPSTVQVTQPTTENIVTTITTSTINENIKRLQEDTQLLQALLQATGNKNRVDMPVISGLTSNVRIASNPLTTSMETKSTTAFNVRPVYTTTQLPPTTTVKSQIITVSTLQPTTEDIGISTTFRPVNIRTQSTSTYRPTVTTEIPSSSTYSDEEDLLFLKNLKSVLSTKTKNEDPETSLANRVIALAVERSLNEIQVGKSVGTTKVMTTTTPTPRPTTTTAKTTTTTTTRATTTPRQNTPSIEDDLKQFEQDTKLLQALLKATGQDPSKFNIPTLPTTTVSAQLPQNINDDLTLLSNLLATPSPLNEPFDPLTQKPAERQTTQRTPTTTVPHGIQIAVKDDLKNEQDDVKLLQTLIKIQDAQETTTMRSKLAITGHSSDEALKKLIQKTQPSGMMSDSTKPSMSLSTEYGNSNDALLAALLKEQGFGPTTASSLDEQIRLAALLNQVVVTPKARRTTTPPPPPPAPRRPILDGLSWLWQQWRDTAPGSQGPRQSRPAPTRNQPAQSASATSSRVNWFGSGPFVGNADERPANRIPLEPPSAVEQPPGRGQLVSAAINVTRAFSQFLGAAIQGAAQTVQNVFRAGQKVASDAYTTGSGGSG